MTPRRLLPAARGQRTALTVASLAAALTAAPAAPVAVAQGTSAATRASAAVPSLPVQPVTLDNGLQVIVVENHSVPLATAKLVVRTGAMTQTEDEQGVPHLFEHMLFKSYRGIDDRRFGYEAAQLQASYNGTTAEELVTYYLTLPSTGAESAVRLLSELARDPHFTTDDLRTERFVVLGEMNRDDSEPRDVLHRAVARELWGAGWMRKNTIGEPAALLGVSATRLGEIYQRYYVPNNAALVVTGDVSTAKVVEAARKHFGGWKRRPDPFVGQPVAAMPPLDSTRMMVLTGDVGPITVLLQWQGPSVRDDVGATYDADVLSDVLDDEESDFTRRMVHEGPFQSAQFGYRTLVHGGPITFAGTTTLEQLPGALTALATELFMMKNPDYFDARALATAAKRRRVAQSFEREEGVTLAHALAYAWAVTGLSYHATYADSLATRRPADLTRFATRYLAGRPYVVGVLAPPGKEQEVAQMLRQFREITEDAK